MTWFIMSAMLALTVAALAAPFFLGASRRQESSENKVYLSQLREVEREFELGLIEEKDAKLARVEIQRRLAAAPLSATLPEEAPMQRFDQITLAAIALGVALGAAWLYATLGSPQTPSSPNASTAHMGAGMPSGAAGAATAQDLQSVDDMLARLEARLADNPDDAEGWRMLGWSRFRMGDAAAAADAYRKALALDSQDADSRSALGEALTRVAGGLVTEEAAEFLKSAIAIAPGDPRAHFLLGLRKEQLGDAEGAVAEWVDLLNAAEPGAPWAADVRARLEETAASSGIDLTGRLKDPSPISAPGPTSADVAAANAMSPEERQAMIMSMVNNLDARLRDEPGNLDGWVRLIKARLVLGEKDKAGDALKRGLEAFPDDAGARAQLLAAFDSPPDISPR